MVEIIGEFEDHKAMDVISNAVLVALNVMITAIDRNLSIAKVDYINGTITLSMLYNEGTSDEFINPDFAVINVRFDSVQGIIKDVMTKVFEYI